MSSIRRIVSPAFALAVAMAAGSTFAAPATFDLAPGPFSAFAFPPYVASELRISGSLTTSAVGTFSTTAEVLDVLNSSSYRVTLQNNSGTLFQLDNSNATWTYLPGLDAPAPSLTVGPQAMALSVFAPHEFTSSAVRLEIKPGISLPRTGLFSFAQVNDVNDVGFTSLDFDAMVNLNHATPGGTPFIFQAAPVPEPSTYAMLIAGLAGLMLVARRRGAATAA